MPSAELLIALVTLSTLEIVLGADNLVFISIAVGRLPHQLRPRARRFGLALACVTRIGLLVVLAQLARMDDTHLRLFTAFGKVISMRDLIMIGGGVFLVPFLNAGLGVDFGVARAVSLMTVIATSSAVSAGTAGRNTINLRLGMVLEVASTTGGLIAGITVERLSKGRLSLIFAIVTAIIAIVHAPDDPRPPTLSANIAASGLDRAKAFYADKLGFEPMAEEPGVFLAYQSGASSFLVYQTTFAGTARNTVAAWRLKGLVDEVARLRRRGVVFEDYDFGPDGKTLAGILSDDEGPVNAWFRDSEGNILAIAEDRG